jgi:hypothetical protein
MHTGMSLDDLKKLSLRQLKVMMRHVKMLYGQTDEVNEDQSGRVEAPPGWTLNDANPFIASDAKAYEEHKRKVLSWRAKASDR